MKVFIDTREPTKTAQWFRNHNWDVEEKCLDVGDILCGDIIFERKTVSDLAGSIQSNRMFEQAQNMQQYPNRYLLVSGNFGQVHRFNIYPVLDGLASLSVRYNLQVLFFPNDSAIFYFAASVMKKRYDGKDGQTIFVKKVSKKEVGLGIVMSLPGVSQNRAKILLEKFGSANDVMNAFTISPEKILELPGFGKKIIINVQNGLKDIYNKV